MCPRGVIKHPRNEGSRWEREWQGSRRRDGRNGRSRVVGEACWRSGCCDFCEDVGELEQCRTLCEIEVGERCGSGWVEQCGQEVLSGGCGQFNGGSCGRGDLGWEPSAEGIGDAFGGLFTDVIAMTAIMREGGANIPAVNCMWGPCFTDVEVFMYHYTCARWCQGLYGCNRMRRALVPSRRRDGGLGGTCGED